MLFSSALPQIHRYHGTEFVFQQDNASPHRATATLSALEEEEISVLSWPALSPDLNPVENLWAILVRRVYAEGRSYQSDDELWEGILAAARTVTVEEVRALIASMPTRLTKLLTNHGKYVQ
jgi:transposase